MTDLPELTDRVLGMLPSGRKIMANADGSYSTHRNVIIGDGPFLLIPTMYGGKGVSPMQALNILRQNNWVDPDTGQRVPSFPTVAAAQAFERGFHDHLAAQADAIVQGGRAERARHASFLKRQP